MVHALVRLAPVRLLAMIAALAPVHFSVHSLAQTPRLVSDLTPGTSSTFVSPIPWNTALLPFENRLLFVTGGSYDRLGISDGSSSRTRLLAPAVSQIDIIGLSRPAPFVNNDLLLFSALDGPYDTPWTSDGTDSGTRPIYQPTSQYFQLGIGPPAQFASVRGLSVFVAGGPGVDTISLWRTDGSPAGTTKLGQFTGLTGLRIAGDVGGTLVMFARVGLNDLLYQSDGTPEGTFPLMPPAPFTGLIQEFAITGSTLFFSASTPETGYELWKWSPPQAPQLVRDMNPGVGSGSPRLLRAGPRAGVFFIAQTSATGVEPWFSDGTPEGTFLLADTLPGPSSGLSLASNVSADNQRVFFDAATAQASDTVTWTSDGTPTGTRPVGNFFPTIEPVGTNAMRRGRLYFGYGAPDGSPYQLWSSDGTAAGTRVFATLPRPTPTSAVGPFVIVHSRLFLTAADAEHGRELWVVDLCPADFNNDDRLSVQDLFDFLTAFLTQDAAADLDGSGTVAIEDVFTFLHAFFSGCD